MDAQRAANLMQSPRNLPPPPQLIEAATRRTEEMIDGANLAAGALQSLHDRLFGSRPMLAEAPADPECCSGIAENLEQRQRVLASAVSRLNDLASTLNSRI